MYSLPGTSVSCVDTIIALSLADSSNVKHTILSSRGEFTVRITVSKRTECGSLLGSENLSTQNHVEYVNPVCGGNMRSPAPMPPIVCASMLPPELTACGAMLGRKRHPNPSELMSNSTNGGRVQEPWALKSLGVVIETSVFMRVRGIGGPGLYGITISGLLQCSGCPKRRNSRSSVGCRACAANLSNMYWSGT